MVFDVAVVGGGVVGLATFYELVRCNQSVVVLEKGLDVCTGMSKANSGLVHAGFDSETGTLKAKLNVLGNQIYPELCSALDVDFIKCGALVVGSDNKQVQALYKRGQANGVPELSVLNRNQLLQIVPNLSGGVTCGLHAATAGIVSPWLFGIALAESGIENGGKVMLGFDLASATHDNGIWSLVSASGLVVQAKTVINSAAAGFNKVSAILGTEQKELQLRRGEYYVIDSAQKNFVPCTVFPLPTIKGKGVLVTPTADGNLLVGPSSMLTDEALTQTTAEGLEYVKNECNSILTGVPLQHCIRVFAGVRVASGHDFIIQKSNVHQSVVLLAGIASPGLTAAPAIGKMVAEMLGVNASAKAMIPRKRQRYTYELSQTELNARIAQNPQFGKVVCRCEHVTEGDIVQALHSTLPPQTVDGVKRRVRAGMGRCQGGFCLSKIIGILSREQKVQLTDVCKENSGSNVLVASIK